MKIYIGIDPGQKGGIATIQDSGFVESIIVNPLTNHRLNHELNACKSIVTFGFNEIICTVEKLWGFPGQSSKTTWAQAENYGIIKGVLIANNIDFNLVAANTWKRHYGLIGKDKQASIDKCKELFPDVNLRRTARCTTDSDGMAEAVLIAQFGMDKEEV
jgi:crossover junction endodeoxyribonuclease RuvC